VQSDESTLESDYQQYVKDQAVVSGYAVAGTPTEAQVEAAFQAAASTVKSVITQSNLLIETVNADVRAAYAYANAASAAGKCGTGPSGPTPQPTIPS
jgi:hypothetical protein